MGSLSVTNAHVSPSLLPCSVSDLNEMKALTEREHLMRLRAASRCGL